MEHYINQVRISDASNILGISIDTIRRWEKKGLIRASRDSVGCRVFDRKELQQIKAKKDGRGDVGYKVLRSRKKSKYSVVELFAGCGGLALGLENAGLDCEMLVEMDKHAAATLRQNRPNWQVLAEDVRGVSFAGIKADIVTGGFPCQSFSYAGKRMGFEDARGTLFFEFARAVKQIKPKAILAENVRGLEKHDNGRTLRSMLDILDDLGYKVEYRLLRAQYLDVPQKRERLVIVGVRKNLQRDVLFPREKNYTVSIGEALRGVPVSAGQEYRPWKKEIMKIVSEGGCWRDLPVDLQKSYMGASFSQGGGKTGMARRLSMDEPSLTLTCNPAQKQTERCHPTETRPLQTREYARIQSFPDKWEFAGSVASKYKQIGNAVPVNMAYHIGKALIAMLDNKYDDKLFVRNETAVSSLLCL